MKKVCIIYNQSLTQIQGINYVNNSFVKGQKYFNENGLKLTEIYGSNGIFYCDGKSEMTSIGSNVNTVAYARKRKIRSFFRKLFSSKFLFGATVKYYFNFLVNARKSVERYFSCHPKADFIIFQDLWSADYYFKHRTEKDIAKTVLILHCSNDPLEQFFPAFPSMRRYKCIEKMLRQRLDNVTRNVDKVIFLSHYAVDASPLSAGKKTYVFNGVEDLEKVEIKEKGDILNIATVASVIEHKGQDFVIRAISRLPEAYKKQLRYYVIGGGTELVQYQQLVEKLNLQETVSFMGPRNDVADLLKRMDLFVLPSISEGMPMSIIEAMRQGLYVLATPVGGIPEMLKPEYGRLIQRNEAVIASELINIIDKNLVTLEAKMASRRAYEKYFTLQKMANAYSEILNSL